MAKGSAQHNFVTKHKIMTAPATKTASRRKAKWTRLVSQKFYQSICRQVHEVSLLSEDITESNVMQCIDDYIDKGSADVEFTDAETVVFTLLQPLIDKAMTRSMRDRAAAARRRELAKTATSATPGLTEAIQPVPATAAEASAAAGLSTATPSEELRQSTTAGLPDENKQAATISPSEPSAAAGQAEATVLAAAALPPAPQTPRDEKRAKRREAALIRRLDKRRKRLARRHSPSTEATTATCHCFATNTRVLQNLVANRP